jgi:hypothetical protein
MNDELNQALGALKGARDILEDLKEIPVGLREEVQSYVRFDVLRQYKRISKAIKDLQAMQPANPDI